MIETLTALIPVFLVIALGWLLKARELFSDEFWETAERLTFYILFPALLIVKIGDAEVGSRDVAPLFAALFITAGAITVAVMGLKPALKLDGKTFVAMLQGMIRPNTYIGLAAAFALYGDAGLTLSAVCILAVIPLVNIISVVALLRWSSDKHDDKPWRTAVRQSIRNPIIVACLIGALLNLSGAGLPALVGESLDILGRAALPLGLMAVGAGLALRALRVSTGTVGASVAVKLLISPFVATIACGLFGVTGVAASVAIVFAALPVSASSYVMTRRMGGDGELMAAIAALSTLAAMGTMPLVIWALAV